ncbi:sprT-like family domain-containing protein [Ditylenchus destructor]|uniref:SprT-like family domain-containing protein n=1 Tax=Ditylenchus destructor TaxID=166010 RepID=A0AAD4MI80_9BILA|nr:sprT-like family domain-containing protein [Ditylenchus destructor]
MALRNLLHLTGRNNWSREKYEAHFRKLYKALNEKLFDSSLPEDVNIEVMEGYLYTPKASKQSLAQKRRRRNRCVQYFPYGRRAPNRPQKLYGYNHMGGVGTIKISLKLAKEAKNSVWQTLVSTLVHEMCHSYALYVHDELQDNEYGEEFQAQCLKMSKYFSVPYTTIYNEAEAL